MGGPFKNSINDPNDFMQKFGQGIKKKQRHRKPRSWNAKRAKQCGHGGKGLRKRTHTFAVHRKKTKITK